MESPSQAPQDGRETPPKSKGATFLARGLSTVLLCGLVGTALVLDNPILIGLIIVLFGTVAFWEYQGMLRANKILSRRASWGAIAIGLAHLSAVVILSLRAEGPVGLWVDSITVSATLILALSFTSLFLKPTENTLDGITSTVFGVVYIPILFSFAIRIYFLGGTPEIEGHRIGLFLLWIALTKATDIGAYLVGTAIGKHKMIPRISPKKTWEGFIGSLVITVAISFLFLHFAGESLSPFSADALPLGLIIALLTVIGDLSASTVKRCLKTKDSGHTLPGIGGLLDLIDSLLFTAPAFYLYLLFAAGR